MSALWVSCAFGQDWAKAKLEKSSRHGEYVQLKHGDRTLQAWVVYPEVSHKATSVLVIHEIFGLTDWARWQPTSWPTPATSPSPPTWSARIPGEREQASASCPPNRCWPTWTPPPTTSSAAGRQRQSGGRRLPLGRGQVV